MRILPPYCEGGWTSILWLNILVVAIPGAKLILTLPVAGFVIIRKELLKEYCDVINDVVSSLVKLVDLSALLLSVVSILVILYVLFVIKVAWLLKSAFNANALFICDLVK